jgi:hypothetical protein
MAFATARGRWLKAGVLMAGAAGSVTFAQQIPIGSVSTVDATVTGASSVADDRAQLSTNGTVVAKDRVAYVQLYRGGSVKVCATSGVHLTAGVPVTAGAGAALASNSGLGGTESNAAGSNGIKGAAPPLYAPPLMVALDRGAMEVRMATIPGDIVMTPDLRFGFSGEGQLDVHIRVTRNGDTCVENRVAGLSGHPELRVGSLFGNETYNVLPGQHVLFEGGSLREVVDNESSPCGCPEAPVKPPMADYGSLSKDAATPTAPTAAAQHPFPADVSEGLAPPPPVPKASPRVPHTQVATTLVYDPGASDGQAKKAAAAAPAEKKGFFHSLGRFFRRLF